MSQSVSLSVAAAAAVVVDGSAARRQRVGSALAADAQRVCNGSEAGRQRTFGGSATGRQTADAGRWLEVAACWAEHARAGRTGADGGGQTAARAGPTPMGVYGRGWAVLEPTGALKRPMWLGGWAHQALTTRKGRSNQKTPTTKGPSHPASLALSP